MKTNLKRDIRKNCNKSRYKFSKSKIKKIRKNPYDIKNQKKKYFSITNKKDWTKSYWIRRKSF